jgi:cellulose synthase/poly-beta-1,6-N-acetylglucosamine synthase-like glycosyltransferase
MTPLLHVIGLGLTFMTFVWLFRILYVYISIKKAREEKLNQNPTIPLHIVLPVLNENRRLKDFVEYYQTLKEKFPSLDLWLVTTEREKHLYVNSKTIKLSEKYAKNISSVHHVHYPQTKGVVANQLNYALKYIPDGGFTVIYNADSRPDDHTFEWILSKDDSRPQVFQQYGIYTKNIKYLSSQPMKSLLLANAFWQVRWSIGLEYYRADSSTRRHNWPWIAREFSYCISHGLFVTTNLIKQLRFSEATINEDAIFGIEAAMLGVDIQPIPYFDTAESPDSTRSIYKQKTNWYQGALQAPLYYKIIKKRVRSKTKLLFICLQQFNYSFYWILGPIFVITTIVLSVINSFTQLLYALYLLAPILFLIAPTITSQVVLNSLGEEKVSIAKLAQWLLIGAIPAYIIHGASGVNGLVNSNRIAKGHKLKTHMSQDGEL